MWFLIAFMFAPHAPATKLTVAALAIVFGIEFFQLTPYPAEWSSHSIIARYTLGGVFEWHDLVGGGIGVILAAGLLPRFLRKSPPAKPLQK
jgi:hypothetical protein